MHKSFSAKLEAGVVNAWYQAHPLMNLIWPLSLPFRMVIALRKYAYQSGLFKQSSLPVPVIVVGNISLGGTGKTPLVCWLADFLKHNGYKPGIISRGYGGNVTSPELVRMGSDPLHVGEEPVLIAKRCSCPVVVGPNRVEAAWALMNLAQVDIIISDDGLQHYALARDIEIAVVDGSRRYGNEYCLPAGPLREPVSRLADVDFVVANGNANPGEYAMKLQPGMNILPVSETGVSIPCEDYKGQTVYAVAGIGNPDRFFRTLVGFGMIPREKGFPDHHIFTRDDFKTLDDLPVIMTEKDAIKCRPFAKKHWGFIPVKAIMDKNFGAALLSKLDIIKESFKMKAPKVDAFNDFSPEPKEDKFYGS